MPKTWDQRLASMGKGVTKFGNKLAHQVAEAAPTLTEQASHLSEKTLATTKHLQQVFAESAAWDHPEEVEEEQAGANAGGDAPAKPLASAGAAASSSSASRSPAGTTSTSKPTDDAAKSKTPGASGSTSATAASSSSSVPVKNLEAPSSSSTTVLPDGAPSEKHIVEQSKPEDEQKTSATTSAKGPKESVDTTKSSSSTATALPHTSPPPLSPSKPAKAAETPPARQEQVVRVKPKRPPDGLFGVIDDLFAIPKAKAKPKGIRIKNPGTKVEKQVISDAEKVGLLEVTPKAAAVSKPKAAAPPRKRFEAGAVGEIVKEAGEIAAAHSADLKRKSQGGRTDNDQGLDSAASVSLSDRDEVDVGGEKGTTRDGEMNNTTSPLEVVGTSTSWEDDLREQVQSALGISSADQNLKGPAGNDNISGSSSGFAPPSAVSLPRPPPPAPTSPGPAPPPTIAGGRPSTDMFEREPSRGKKKGEAAYSMELTSRGGMKVNAMFSSPQTLEHRMQWLQTHRPFRALEQRLEGIVSRGMRGGSGNRGRTPSAPLGPNNSDWPKRILFYLATVLHFILKNAPEFFVDLRFPYVCFWLMLLLMRLTHASVAGRVRNNLSFGAGEYHSGG